LELGIKNVFVEQLGSHRIVDFRVKISLFIDEATNNRFLYPCITANIAFTSNAGRNVGLLL
jgi:hypothetical protein